MIYLDLDSHTHTTHTHTGFTPYHILPPRLQFASLHTPIQIFGLVVTPHTHPHVYPHVTRITHSHGYTVVGFVTVRYVTHTYVVDYTYIGHTHTPHTRLVTRSHTHYHTGLLPHTPPAYTFTHTVTYTRLHTLYTVAHTHWITDCCIYHTRSTFVGWLGCYTHHHTFYYIHTQFRLVGFTHSSPHCPIAPGFPQLVYVLHTFYIPLHTF